MRKRGERDVRSIRCPRDAGGTPAPPDEEVWALSRGALAECFALGVGEAGHAVGVDFVQEAVEF